MGAFVCTFGMVDALSSDHHHDAGKLFPAILAGVFFLLRAFVQFVTAFVGAVGMAGASGRSELADIRELLSAIFTVIIRSFHGN